MPGFDFRYRLGGGQPTIRRFVFKNTETLTRGDMLNFEGGHVDFAVLGDKTLLGCATETLDGEGGKTYIRAVTDADAVYAVEDPSARKRGDHLDLTGATGAQGVAPSPASQFTVVLDSSAVEETLVTIEVGLHHQIGDEDGLERPTGGDLNAAIARAVVRFHRRETGRGPTKARAFYRDDVIVVLLEEVMTQAERRLVARGQRDAVMQVREAFQNSMRADLTAAIEELTGARVRAFMGSNHLDPDLAVEVFVLDRPIGGGEIAAPEGPAPR
jgi:uncharacterized protein YbcI